MPSLALPWIALLLGLFALYCVLTESLGAAALPLFGASVPLTLVLPGLLGSACLYYLLVGRRRFAERQAAERG